MSRAIWSSLAQRDLADLDLYCRDIDPRVAERMARAAVAAGRLLAESPRLGEVVLERGVRKWRVRQTPYLIFYRPEGAGIRIVRLVPASRDWRELV